MLHQLGTLSGLLGAAEGHSRLSVQFGAACEAIQGCAQLSDWLQLTHDGAFRLASALALVFGTGPPFLHQSAPTAEACMAALQRLDVQLETVGMVLTHAAHPQHQPQAAAAFVRTAGRPQAVLPWLRAASQTLLAAPVELWSELSEPNARGGWMSHAPSGRFLVHGMGLPVGSLVLLNAYCHWLCRPAGWQASCLEDYAAVAYYFCGIHCEAYRSALKQAPALQHAVLSVLLDRCLQLLAADCSPETIADESHPHSALSINLGPALASPCLESKLAAVMQQSGSAALIQQALRVVAALPLHRSAAAATSSCFGEQHAAAATLLGCLCDHAGGCNCCLELCGGSAAHGSYAGGTGS